MPQSDIPRLVHVHSSVSRIKSLLSGMACSLVLHCRPSLAAGAEEWNPMVAAVLVATAGLFKYLGDVYPPDLPEYDPV